MPCMSRMDLPTQCQMHEAIMVFKSWHGLGPHYFYSKFIKRDDFDPYSLNLSDSPNKPNIPLARTDYHEDSFSYSGGVP